MKLYRAWLDQVSPGADPNFFGMYAWSAARLFVQEAVALGGKLNRQTLVAAMSKVKNWTSNGMHAPQQVGVQDDGGVLQDLPGQRRDRGSRSPAATTSARPSSTAA